VLPKSPKVARYFAILILILRSVRRKAMAEHANNRATDVGEPCNYCRATG
jgi:hypothetical protein